MSTWKNRALALVAATALVIVPSVPALAAGEVNQPSESQQILSLMNQARAAEGLAPLAGWSGLDSAAVNWSTQMSTTGVFDHASGQTLLANSASAGCSGQVGENIAWTTVTSGKAQSIFDSYMNSTQGHREAILSTTYKYVGVGTVTNSAGRTYNTIRFSTNCAPITLPTPVISFSAETISGTGNDRVATLSGQVTNAGNATSVPMTVRVTSSVTGLTTTYAVMATGTVGNLQFNANIPRPTQSTVQFLIGADAVHTAASATTTINGATVNQWAATPVTTSVDIEEPGRVAIFDVSVAPVAGQSTVLQKSVGGGAWATVDTRTSSVSDYYLNFQLTDEIPQVPQVVTYRVVSGTNISNSVDVTYQWSSAVLPTTVAGWPTEATVIDRYLDSAAPSFSLDVTPARGRLFQVQEFVGGTWQTVNSQTTAVTNTWATTVVLPTPSVVGDREFRLYASANQWSEAFTSQTVTVRTNKFPLTVEGWDAQGSALNVYPDNTSGSVSLPLTITGGYDRPLYLSRDGGPALAQTVVGDEQVSLLLPFSKTAPTVYTAWITESAQYSGWTSTPLTINFIKYATVINGWGDAREVDIYEGDETVLDLSGWHFKTADPDTAVGNNPVAVIQYRTVGTDSWNDSVVVTLSDAPQSVTLPTPALNASYEYRAVVNGTQDYDGYTTSTLTVNKVLAPVEVTGWEGGSVTHTVETPLTKTINVNSPRDILVFLQVWSEDQQAWTNDSSYSGSEFTIEIPTNNLGVTTYRIVTQDDYSELFASEPLEVDVIRSVASVDWDVNPAYLNSGDTLDLSFTVLPNDGRNVTLESSVDGGISWQEVETFSATGLLTYTYEPTETATLLRVVAPQTAWVSAIESPSREVFVNVTPVSLTGVPSGLNYIAATDSFSFNVSSSLTDDSRNIEVQKFEAGAWVTVLSDSLGEDRSFDLAPGSKGTLGQYRLFVADAGPLKPGTTSEIFSVVSEAVPVSVNGWVSSNSYVVGTSKTSVDALLSVAPYLPGETSLALRFEQYNAQGELVFIGSKELVNNNGTWAVQGTLEELLNRDIAPGQVVLRIWVPETAVNNSYITPSVMYQVVDGSTTVNGWPDAALQNVSVLDTVAFDIGLTPNIQGREIELQETVDGGDTWTTLNTIDYASGASAVRVTLPAVPSDLLAGGVPSQTKFYRLSVPASGIYDAVTTETLAVEYVRATGAITVIASDTYIVDKDGAIVVSVATSPLAGTVSLERNDGDGWELVRDVDIDTTPTSVSIPTDVITGTRAVEYRFVLATSDNVTGAISQTFAVKVIDRDQSVVNWVTGNIQTLPDTLSHTFSDLKLTPVLDNTRQAFLEKSTDGSTWTLDQQINLSEEVSVTVATPAPNTTEHWRVRVEAQDYLPAFTTDTFTIEAVKFPTSLAGVWNDAEVLNRYVGETVNFDVTFASTPGQDRPIQLEELVDGEWLSLGEYSGTLPVSTEPGAHVYRLTVAETPTITGYSSGELTVVSALRPVTLSGWSAGSISTFIGQDVVVPVEVATAGESANIFRIALASVSEPLSVSLQVEEADGTWTTVETYEDVTGAVDVTIPSQTLGAFAYRLFIPATETSAELTSEVLNVEVTRYGTSITEVAPTNQVTIGDEFSVNFTVNPTDLLRVATLQELVDGEWVDVVSTETVNGTVNFGFDTSVIGAHTYRVNVAETETHEGVTSSSFSVDVIKVATVVTGWETKVDVPFGTTVTPVINFSVDNLDGRPVFIERFIEGEWVRSEALTYEGLEAADRAFAFTLPLLGNVTENTSISYRLVVEESETISGYVSETLVVNYLAKSVTPTTPTGTGTPTNTGTSTPTVTPSKSSTKTSSASPSSTKGAERLEDTGSEGMLPLMGLSAIALLGGAGVLAYRRRNAEN